MEEFKFELSQNKPVDVLWGGSVMHSPCPDVEVLTQGRVLGVTGPLTRVLKVTPHPEQKIYQPQLMMKIVTGNQLWQGCKYL